MEVESRSDAMTSPLAAYIDIDQTLPGSSDHPHHQLLVSSHDGDLPTVRKLLDQVLTAPIDLAAHDQHGRTALALASWSGHLDIVRLLLERGASWHTQDNEGLTAAQYALLEGHQHVYNELLEAGIRTELVLKALEGSGSINSNTYLRGGARYTDDTLVDDANNGVMMSWETPLMHAHAQAMQCTGRDVLNVGFGMGIVDLEIQRLQPRTHTIVEAHPDVYARMLSMGWDRLPGVRILFGRWQDVLPQLETYDAIMFDTFDETDAHLSSFHDALLDLLRPHGVYTFFNGLAATNFFFHDVSREVTRLCLMELGLDTVFHPISIDTSADEIWSGVKDRYWVLKTYYLPVCTFQR